MSRRLARRQGVGRVQCHLTVVGDLPHTYQILTGYLLLAQAGLVDLEIAIAPERAPWLPTPHLVEARLDASTGARALVAYDLRDGYNASPEAVPLSAYLAGVDRYYKRSFAADLHTDLPTPERVAPLGLNYCATPPASLWRRLALARGPYGHGSIPRALARYAAMQVRGDHRWSRVSRYEAPLTNGRTTSTTTSATTGPEVLYCTRVWEPSGITAQATHQINTQRVEIVRALRATFGPRCLAGLSGDTYSRAAYPDLVLPETTTTRHAYLGLVKRALVCVASVGLHGSTGWKLAEYLAASRAVVSDPLCYSLPGNFANPTHYLPYTTPDQCVSQAAVLLADPDLRQRMAQANWRYYQRYVRPDQVVWRTICDALGTSVAQGSALPVPPPREEVPLEVP
jgi:hypothetical protein